MLKGNKRDIHERLYKFALSILGVIKYIPRSIENQIMIRQVVRSSSSMGANGIEADGAETKKEFIHRFTICKKESKESYYWLNLITDHNPETRTKLLPIIQENKELILIISKIILNTKNKS